MSMTFSTRMKSGDEDRSYRIRVLLLSDQRKYRKFYCQYCGVRVCEIEDRVIYTSDLADDTQRQADKSGIIAIECPGKFCRTKYEFSLRS